jgi:hypothetical protein
LKPLEGVSPLIEEPVFVLVGPSVLHFPAPLNLLMAEGGEGSPLAFQAFTDGARLVVLKRNASEDQFLTSRYSGYWKRESHCGLSLTFVTSS